MDFIKLFNGVTDLVKPVSASDSYAQSMDDNLTELGFDSLDHLMFAVYFGDIYGISEEVMRTVQAKTVRELQEYLEANKTKTPESVEAALEMVR